MNSFERIRAAVRGEPLDRLPRTLWRHFPIDDETATGLADTTVAFQEMYGWDLVKVCHNSQHSTEDWGNDVRWPMTRQIWGRVRQHRIQTAEDWATIKPLDVTQGAWGREVEAVRMICERLAGVPVLATVFSPLVTAVAMAEPRIMNDIEDHAAVVHQALEAIADTTARFVAAAMKAGAHGVFYALGTAQKHVMTVDQFNEFGRRYDLPVLEGAESAFLNMLHVHGENLMFEEVLDYPVHALNWYDRGAGPSIQQAVKLTDKLLIGGIDEVRLPEMSRSEIAAHIHDVAPSLPGKSFMWGPGCVVPLAVTYERMWWIREALDQLGSRGR